MAASVITCRATVFSTSAASSYTTTQTAYTPAANSLLVAFVENSLAATPLDPTFTGHGVTWTKLTLGTRLCGTTHCMSVWVAKAGASPTSTKVVADFGGVNQTGCSIIEYEITNADVSGTSANAIKQNPTGTAASGTTGTVTYAARNTPENFQLSCFLHLANEVTTPRASWVEDTTVASDGNFNTPATGFEAQYRNDGTFDTSSTATWSTSINWLGVGLEIKHPIERSVSDAITVAESSSKVAARLKSVSDSITVTENVSRTAARLKSVSDSITVTESVSKQVGFQKLNSDAITVAESVTAKLGTLEVQLRQGATLIASRILNPGASATSETFVLTSGEIANISNWGDLRFRFIANGIQVDVTQAFLTAPAAAPLSASVFDAITLTESVTKAIGGASISASVFDAITLTENLKAVLNLGKRPSETITLVEAVSRLATTYKSLAETLTVTENVSLRSITNIQKSVADAIAITEVVLRIANTLKSVNDAITVTENVQRRATTLKAVSEVIAVTEFVSRLANTLKSVQDSIAVVENVSTRLLTTKRSTSFETILVAEAVQFLANTRKTVVDTISITESVVRLVTTSKLLQETISVAEFVTKYSTNLRSVSDSITVAEAVFRLVSNAKSAFDAISIIENLKLQATNLKSVSETVTLAENVTRVANTFKAVSEAITVQERVILTAGFTRSVFDTITVAEAVTKQVTNQKQVSESITVLESVSRLVNTLKVIAETITVTEFVRRIADIQKTLSESVTVTESVTRQVGFQKLVAENISLVENVMRLATTRKTLSESISVTENVSRLANILKVASEAIHVAESVSTQLLGGGVLFTSKAEAITVSEALFFFTQTSLRKSEAIAVAEAVFRLATTRKILSENITVAENVQTFLHTISRVFRSVFDSVTVSEMTAVQFQAFVQTLIAGAPNNLQFVPQFIEPSIFEVKGEVRIYSETLSSEEFTADCDDSFQFALVDNFDEETTLEDENDGVLVVQFQSSDVRLYDIDAETMLGLDPSQDVGIFHEIETRESSLSLSLDSEERIVDTKTIREIILEVEDVLLLS